MRLTGCFLLWLSLSSAETLATPASGVFLKATVTGHVMIVGQVFLNGAGPFRMIVDTGSASSSVSPAVARRLQLKPVYAVQQSTVSATHRVPVAFLDEVRTGSVSDHQVEAMITTAPLDGVDGVLGQSWLAHHDYLLDYRNHQIVLDSDSAGSGVRLPLGTSDGRPMVMAVVEGQNRPMVIDSGSSSIVLFEKLGPASPAWAVVDGGGSAAPAQRCTVRFGLSAGQERRADAVRVNTRDFDTGLLPASAFGSVFISNRSGFVEFRK